MPAYDTSRKENAAAAAPLHRGGRVPQRRAATAAPGPTLDIPIDDDLLAAEPVHRATPSQVSSGCRLRRAWLLLLPDKWFRCYLILRLSDSSVAQTHHLRLK